MKMIYWLALFILKPLWSDISYGSTWYYMFDIGFFALLVHSQISLYQCGDSTLPSSLKLIMIFAHIDIGMTLCGVHKILSLLRPYGMWLIHLLSLRIAPVMLSSKTSNPMKHGNTFEPVGCSKWRWISGDQVSFLFWWISYTNFLWEKRKKSCM